jgi:iron complex outermembrane receptor protein
MKKLLFFTILGLQSWAAIAQTITGSISSSVANVQKPVESATISVLHAADSSLVKMAVSDKGGLFAVQNIKFGKYLIQVSAVGFAKGWSAPFEISEIQKDIQIPAITLETASAQALQSVIVTSKKPFIEQKIDRMVVNVDAQVSNTGLTALDVLEKSPGIAVDKDGNISLKGKDGVMILIDGKPSYLSGADLANMLRSMPSSQLEQLEIMTNPPAKFDASGTAGVINIKTKKNKARGFNGNFSLGAGMGNFPKTNNSLNLNYRYNKWNIYASGSYNYNRQNRNLSLTRKFSDSATHNLQSIFRQSADTYSKNFGYNAKIGADFYASKKTTLGVVFTGFDYQGIRPSDNVSLIYDANSILESQTKARNEVNGRWKNFTGNFNFRHEFDSTGRELTADLDYSVYDNSDKQSFSNYFFDKNGGKIQPDEFLKGNLPSLIKIYSAKADYVHPLSKSTKLEAGFKVSYVTTDNNAQYTQMENNQWVIDSSRSNHFIYKENINAAYVNANHEFTKKWSAQLGLRMENTNASGRQVVKSENFDRHYTQLFPTAYVAFKPTEKHQLSVNYGRRIERPDYDDLNPFFSFVDKYTYQVGNPNLKPQFTHNIELSHTYKSFLTTTLNYSHTKDIINDVLEQIDSTHTSFVRKSNIASRKQFGLSVSAGFPITKWWRTNIYANGFHNDFEGVINNQLERVKGWAMMTNINNQFTLGKGWSAELSGFFRSKNIQGILVSQPMGVINIGFGKQILKNQGSVRLNFRDPFDLQYFRGYSKYQNVDVTIKNTWDNRVVNLTFNYRFGKPVKGPKSRNDGGASDEQGRVKTGGN